MEVDDVEAVVEVLAEFAAFDGVGQVPVGGGDDADVGLDRLVLAEAVELALLEDAEELALGGQGHLPDLVEEEGAAVSQLEFADPLGHGAGEGAALVAEELALQQVLGDGGAVDGDEELLGARAVLVDGAGDELLAGAALAGDEDGGVGRRDLPDGLVDALHGGRGADDGLVALDRGDLIGHDDFLAHGAGGVEGAAEEVLELGDVEGLEDVIVGAELHRLDGGLRGAVGGHHDDDLPGGHLADLLEGLEAVLGPHPDVHDDDVDGAVLGQLALEDLQALVARFGAEDLDRLGFEEALEGVVDVLLVVDHQQARLGGLGCGRSLGCRRGGGLFGFLHLLVLFFAHGMLRELFRSDGLRR